MPKHVEPSPVETAFNCPHCAVLAAQGWFTTQATGIRNDHRVPMIIREEEAAEMIEALGSTDAAKRALTETLTKQVAGEVFFDGRPTGLSDQRIENLFVSRCFNCGKLAIWVYEQLVHPPQRFGIEPNEDLDDEIKRDFNEARSIVNLSPRGAAALLRLALQKLCQQLGEKGENINDDIASLVGKGLNQSIQKALDVVRVVGNESVHPGELDLRDDRDTAIALFGLVNLICDQMISQPKHVDRLYDSLPQSKIASIEARNAKAASSASASASAPKKD